jgi:uncharacterized protein (TIGR02145 family)
MIDQNLVSYIKESLKQGSTRSDIENTLLAKGWQGDIISEGFKTIEISKPESTNSPEAKTGFSALPKKIGWRIFSILILLIPVLYTASFVPFSGIFLEYFKYSYILDFLSSFVWFLVIGISCLLVFLYKKNKIESDQYYEKFFYMLYIGAGLLIVDIFHFLPYFIVGFLPYFSPVVNSIFPIISIIFALKAINKSSKIFKILISFIVVLSLLAIYFSTQGSIYFLKLTNNFWAARDQIDIEVKQQNNPEACKKLGGPGTAMCYYEFALLEENRALLNADYCAKISSYDFNIGSQCYGTIGDCEKALKGDEKSAIFCYRDQAQKTKDPKTCEAILKTSMAKEWWAAPQCYLILAQVTNNSDFCEKAYEIGGEKIINENLDLPYCSEAFNEIIKNVESKKVSVCEPMMTDSEGNIYKTVKIENQCWMAENLRTKTKPDGTALTNLSNGSERDCISKNGVERGTEEDCKSGYTVYTWDGAMNGSTAEKSQGICPKDWHIPTNFEFNFLTKNLTNAGQLCVGEAVCAPDYTKIKQKSASSFNDILPGTRVLGKQFRDGLVWADYLSSSEVNSSDVWLFEFSSLTVSNGSNSKKNSYSVRCVKD